MPLLPLDIFFDIMGFNHWHAWGFADQDLLRVTESCDPIFFEEASQNGSSIGRQDFRSAIDEACESIYLLSGYYPAPRFYEVESQYPRVDDRRMTRVGPWDADSRWLNIRLKDYWILSTGIEAFETIQLEAPITRYDVNSDGYDEYWQIGPIPTTVTDISEIACYFSSTDRWDGTGIEEKWRVEPLNVTISGGNLTIRGRPWTIGTPVSYLGIEPQPLNPDHLNGDFVTTLDVIRRYVNRNGSTVDTSQAQIIWESRPCHGWWCLCSDCCSCGSDLYSGSYLDPSSVAIAIGRVGIRDRRRGIVTPAESIYNPTTGYWEGVPDSLCWEPDRVVIRVYAGVPLESNGWMSNLWRPVVAHLAAAKMVQDICGCAEARRRIFHWQGDLAKTGADKDTFATTAEQLNNPLGTRRGHWEAWNLIMDQARVVGKRV